jgi:hypothetical protein
MSKHRLLLDDGYEYLVFGISCHLKDYRVAGVLNQALGMDFIRQSIDLPVKGGKMDRFPCFLYKNADVHLRYMLLDNQNDEVYLMGNLKQYDFFLFIEGYIEVFPTHAFQSRLRAVESFQLVSEIDPSAFEHIQYALFED